MNAPQVMSNESDEILEGPRYGIPGHLLGPRIVGSGDKQKWKVTCSCGWQGAPCKTRKRALRFAIDRHLAAPPEPQKAPKVVIPPSPPPSPCPTPEKQRFRNRTTAEQELSNFWRSRRALGKAMPCRVYKCPCGYWHMTKRPERDR